MVFKGDRLALPGSAPAEGDPRDRDLARRLQAMHYADQPGDNTALVKSYLVRVEGRRKTGSDLLTTSVAYRNKTDALRQRAQGAGRFSIKGIVLSLMAGAAEKKARKTGYRGLTIGVDRRIR